MALGYWVSDIICLSYLACRFLFNCRPLYSGLRVYLPRAREKGRERGRVVWVCDGDIIYGRGFRFCEAWLVASQALGGLAASACCHMTWRWFGSRGKGHTF